MSKVTYLVAGGAGFIGSNFVKFLNSKGINDIIIFDEIDHEKLKNINECDILLYEDKDRLLDYIKRKDGVQYICIFLGANSNTTSKDRSIIKDNTETTLDVAEACRENNIPLIYASSASVYGNKRDGSYQPLCLYSYSKYLVDNYFEKIDWFNKMNPPTVGLRFFNVAGEGEAHKGSQASVVWNWWSKKWWNYLEIFGGTNMRDFVAVDDVCKVIYFFAEKFANSKNSENLSGIYDVGTGIARDFNDIAEIFEKRYNLEIKKVAMPNGLREQYQTFTQANLTKLRAAGYKEEFMNLEELVNSYLDKLDGKDGKKEIIY